MTQRRRKGGNEEEAKEEWEEMRKNKDGEQSTGDPTVVKVAGPVRQVR